MATLLLLWAALFIPVQLPFFGGTALSLSGVKAHNIEFDGKKVKLTGNVHIEHQMGHLFCDKADLLLAETGEGSRGFVPTHIFLVGHVRMELTDGSTLHATQADINCAELDGFFTAKEPEKVIYTTFLQENASKIPVKTTSKAMRVKMQRVKDTYVISDIKGEGAVSIEYLTEARIDAK